MRRFIRGGPFRVQAGAALEPFLARVQTLFANPQPGGAGTARVGSRALMSVEQLLLWRALKRGWPVTGADLQARLEGLALANLLSRHGSGLAGLLASAFRSIHRTTRTRMSSSRAKRPRPRGTRREPPCPALRHGA